MESSQSTIRARDLSARAEDQPAAGPMSPCVSICTLDERGFCRGCFRSLAEISNWLRMSSEQRWAVLGELEQRRPLPLAR
jgi:hypothetical protein